MGYFAHFTGELAVNPPLTDREAVLVRFFGNDIGGLSGPVETVGYEVGAEGALITIDVSNKPSAVVENLDDLLNMLANGSASAVYPDAVGFLTEPPTIHVITGKVRYSGEDAEDTGEVTIENSRLTVDW